MDGWRWLAAYVCVTLIIIWGIQVLDKLILIKNELTEVRLILSDSMCGCVEDVVMERADTNYFPPTDSVA